MLILLFNGEETLLRCTHVDLQTETQLLSHNIVASPQNMGLNISIYHVKKIDTYKCLTWISVKISHHIDIVKHYRLIERYYLKY